MALFLHICRPKKADTTKDYEDLNLQIIFLIIMIDQKPNPDLCTTYYVAFDNVGVKRLCTDHYVSVGSDGAPSILLVEEIPQEKELTFGNALGIYASLKGVLESWEDGGNNDGTAIDIAPQQN